MAQIVGKVSPKIKMYFVRNFKKYNFVQYEYTGGGGGVDKII